MFNFLSTAPASEVTEKVIEEASKTVNIDITNPNFSSFVDNLQYMASGMISIFIVIGAIVAVVYGLNAVTSRKKKNKDNQQ